MLNVNKTGSNVMLKTNFQKQPPRGVLSKRCYENMQQIYRRKPMPKCDFNKVAKQISMNLLSPAQQSWRRKGAIFQV